MRSLSGPVDYVEDTPPPAPGASPALGANMPTDPASQPSKEAVTSAFDSQAAKAASKKGRSCWGFGHIRPEKAAGARDVEKGEKKAERPTRLLAPFYGGIGCALSVCKSLPSQTC